MQSLRRGRALWGEEDSTYSSLGVRLPPDHPALAARAAAWDVHASMTAAGRDWLLHALATGAEAPDVYFAWLDQFEIRTRAYFAASSAVTDALIEHRDRAMAKLTPEQRHYYWFRPGPAPGSVEEWQEAERAAEAVLQQLGFEDAARTPPGSDKGLDVTSPVVAAQMKYTSIPVGRPVLQQLQGAAAGRITVFFSRAGYSSTAVEYASEVGMALFRPTLPVSVVAVNESAQRMVRDHT